MDPNAESRTHYAVRLRGGLRFRQVFRWGFGALVTQTAILQAHLDYIRISGNFTRSSQAKSTDPRK